MHSQPGEVNPVHQLDHGTFPQMFWGLCLCANKILDAHFNSKWLSGLHCEILIVVLENVCSICVFYWQCSVF